MKLYELAYCCRLYAELSDDDQSLTSLGVAVGANWDLADPKQRQESLNWLRTWGCRQFKKSEDEVASGSISRWWNVWNRSLPAREIAIKTLNSGQRDQAALAYEDLAKRKACTRGNATVRFGPAGASKLLGAIRPGAFPIWDEPIRTHLGATKGVKSYRDFMECVVREIGDLVRDAKKLGVDEKDIPQSVGRSGVPLAKLFDEYHWITVTREHEPPGAAVLEKWLRWSKHS